LDEDGHYSKIREYERLRGFIKKGLNKNLSVRKPYTPSLAARTAKSRGAFDEN
jgi:hypothetical protein